MPKFLVFSSEEVLYSNWVEAKDKEDARSAVSGGEYMDIEFVIEDGQDFEVNCVLSEEEALKQGMKAPRSVSKERCK